MSPPQSLETEYEAAARKLLGSLPERWGRMGLMGRAALVEVGLALHRENLLDENARLRPESAGGLIIGTRRGSLAVDLEYGNTLKAGAGMASPHLFGYTLPNIPLAEAAIRYNLTGPVFCLVSDDPFAEAVEEARQWLAETAGNTTLMVAGALDVIPSEPAEASTQLTVLYT